MIPPSFIQDLLNRVDIVDVVGQYVPLKKGGANLIGLCPFHSEKTPSFTVSPSKQFFHCFGCGKNGTAIGFLMEYSGLGFIDAVQTLAQSVGMTVPEDDRGISPGQREAQQSRNMALAEVMSRADQHYRKQLRASPAAIDYLKKRGLTGEIAAKFALGFAPEEWDALRAAFPDYDADTLVEAGLVIERDAEEGQKRKRYDRFRGRIIFPIRNTKGQTIGFGGRVIDNSEPKYLNSPETPLFHKGSELYGLFEARQAIREAGYALVTEGYMDVVALAQLGFPQTVATLGTACTPAHVQKLLRHTDEIIFSFDGDGAGLRAARRALEASLPYAADNKRVRFLFLPTGHDPDSFVRTYGAPAFEQLVKDAAPLSQFLVQQIAEGCDLSSAEGRARLQFNAKPLLQMMPMTALRLQIVRSLAQMAQMTLSEMELSLGLAKPGNPIRSAPVRTKRPQPVGLERQILRLLLAHPVLASEIDADAMAAMAHASPDHAQMLLQLLEPALAMGANANFAALCEHLRAAGSEFDVLIDDVAAGGEFDLALAHIDLRSALNKLKIAVIDEEMKRLSLAGMASEPDKQRYRELDAKKKALLTSQSGQPEQSAGTPTYS